MLLGVLNTHKKNWKAIMLYSTQPELSQGLAYVNVKWHHMACFPITLLLKMFPSYTHARTHSLSHSLSH